MEVVIEASLASTNNMELDKDLKKWSRMTKNHTSIPTAAKKELPEQKQTCNNDKSAKPLTRALFIDKPMETTDTEMLKDSQDEDTMEPTEMP